MFCVYVGEMDLYYWYFLTFNIYLFIYCHLYSAFSIVQCSNALYRLWDGEIQGHTGQPSVQEIDAHTMYNHWATAPGRSLNYPRPKSITHLRTFSDNGVYVALQLFLVILVSDQWRRVLIPYSYRQAPWGLLHARGWLSRYTWDQRLYVVSEPRETHSSMLKARFLHLTNFGSSRGSNPGPLAYQASVLPLSHGSLSKSDSLNTWLCKVHLKFYITFLYESHLAILYCGQLRKEKEK